MKRFITTYRGIHPGKIIGRDLQKRHLSQRAFARSIGEHNQTLNAVITGRRALTLEMSLKIEQAFNYEEGSLLVLQTFYDIAAYKNREASRSISGVPDIRRSLFWDTDFDTLDWGRYRQAVLARVAERGNEQEKQEIARFYGIDPKTVRQYKPANTYHIKRNNG
ncbi:MAG: HigA family addiction module antitoxin [Bacteroides sp.]|nr:HigA family addiction module antitoxin [Bacteroides sp.]